MRILDGAVGTELARQGFSLDPPAFAIAANQKAPNLVCEIYQGYLQAGAQSLTLNSFGLSGALDLSTPDGLASLKARAQHAWRLASPFAKQTPTWAALSLGMQRDPASRLFAESEAILETGLSHLRFETLCELRPILDQEHRFLSLLERHQTRLSISLCPVKTTMTQLLEELEASALLRYSRLEAIGINCVNSDHLVTALGELSSWYRPKARELKLRLELRPHLSGITKNGSWDTYACSPRTLVQSTRALLTTLPEDLLDHIALGTCCGGGPAHIQALKQAFSP